MAKKRTTNQDEPINSAPSKPRSADRHKPRRTISLPPSLYNELAELAKKNRRPLLWEARLAIEKHLEASRGGG